jgi:hypothetical protein
MSELFDPKSASSSSGSWSVLTREPWETQDELLVALADAVCGIDGIDDDLTLSDSVDIEAVIAALLPDQRSRGVSEIRFEIDGYEIRVIRDGVIAAQSTSGASKPLSA